MTDDLDLRVLHGRHEPDPEFRTALRRRVEAVVARPPSVDPTDHPHEQELIMLTDTPTDHPNDTPRRRRWVLPAVAAAAIAAVVAGTVAVRAGDDDDHRQVTASSDVVFRDAFDDDAGDWQTDVDVRREGGEQVWTISPPGQTVFLLPLANEKRVRDMEISATVASADPDSTVGLYCRKGPGDQDFYYYATLAPTGASLGVLPDEPDAPGEVLATDPAVVRPDGPFELTVRCVDAAGATRLTMLIDGDVVLEASYDTPLPAGNGALMVQAGAPGSRASEVHWDDVEITALG